MARFIVWFLALWALYPLPVMAVDVEPVLKTKQTGGDELFTADVYSVTGKYRVGVDATQAGTWTVVQGAQGTSTSPWYVNLRSAAGTEMGSVASPLVVKSTITTGGVYGEITVGLTPVEVKVGASRLPLRRLVTMMPIDRDMWWGYNNSLTTANGTPVFKYQFLAFDADDTASIFLVTDIAAKKARISEAP